MQDCQELDSNAGLPGTGLQCKTARNWTPMQDCQQLDSNAGLPGTGLQCRTARYWTPMQDCQELDTNAGLLGWDCTDLLHLTQDTFSPCPAALDSGTRVIRQREVKELEITQNNYHERIICFNIIKAVEINYLI
jgi:hypothetical protein